MSKLLVKKAFELLQEDLRSEEPKNKKQRIKPKKYHAARKIDGKQKLSELKERKNSSIEKKMKMFIDKYKNEFLIDRTEENLQVLQKLRNLKPKASAAEKILEFHYKQQNHIIEPAKEVSEPKSILFEEVNKKRKKK